MSPYLKVGYVPYVSDLNSPGDRRRFCYYAKKRGIEFEIADPARPYDLVVLSTQADLSVWSYRPKRARRIIFDLPDSYLGTGASLAERIKAPVKYLTGRWQRFEWRFEKALLRMCSSADAVICSTPEQRKVLLVHNPEVRDILDFHAEEISVRKTDLSGHTPFRIVWEGVGNSLFGLSTVSEALGRLSHEHRVELHILTDLRFRRLNSPFEACARKVVDRQLPGISSFLYQWNRAFFSEIVTGCDLAIIPAETRNLMVAAKPENRLLLFWRMGLPALTSHTPAYARVMDAAGMRGTCANSDEWYDSLARYLLDQEARGHNLHQGRRYLEHNCSEEQLLQRWDNLFQTLLGS